MLRRHTLVLVGSGLFPLFGYFLYLCGWSPWKLDLAPLMLALRVMLAYLAIFKFEYFDLLPMARSLVFHSTRDAAIVTDMREQLVESNAAAAVLFPCLTTAKPGDDINSVFRDPNILGHGLESREVEVVVSGERQYFDVRVFPLEMDTRQLGWATIFANITARQRLLEELRRHAHTDEFTGVANRRSFVSALKRESARSVRHHFSYSLIFVDLDYFKDINDGYGHTAGDRALRTVAEVIRACLRNADHLSRYGGDDFAILLPQTESQAALEVAEFLSRFPKTMSRLAAPVGFIAGQLGRQGVAELERLATALYIRRENKKADPEEIAAALVNLKPHIQYADAVVATRDIDRMALAAKEI